MSAKQPLIFTTEHRLSQETPLELGPWELEGEPMLPARRVVWTSLALIVVTLGVLLFG